MRRLLPEMRPCAVAIVLASGVLGATPAAADTLCVNPGGTDGCFASIQAAVDAAGTGLDTIDVAAGTYNENVSVAGGSTLSIRGAGATATVIDAGGGDGIGAGAYYRPVRLTVSDLTVRNAIDGIWASQGNRVSVLRCIVQDSVADGISGGSGSRLVVEDTTVDGAHTGLYSAFGRARILRSTFTNATFGIIADSAVIDSSTVSGNDVGISISTGPRTRIRSSTIVNNDNPSFCPAGLMEFSSNVVLSATIIANNTCPGPFADTNDDITSRGYNLIEDGDSSQIQGRHDLDITGTDPVLGPLQDNGGPTATHALLGGSPALGVVPRVASCRPDQRGVPRVVPCDIGAFEAP